MAIGLNKSEITANELLEEETIDTQKNEPKYEVVIRLYLKGKLFKESEIICDTQKEVNEALNQLKAKLNNKEDFIVWGPCMFERKRFRKVKIFYRKIKNCC